MPRRRSVATTVVADSAAAVTSSPSTQSAKQTRRRSKRARSATADDTAAGSTLPAHTAVDDSLAAARRDEREAEQSAAEAVAPRGEEKQDGIKADSGRDDAEEETAEQKEEAVAAGASAGSTKQRKRKRAKAKATLTKTKRKKSSGAAAADKAEVVEAEAATETETTVEPQAVEAGAEEADKEEENRGAGSKKKRKRTKKGEAAAAATEETEEEQDASKEEKAEAAEEKKEGADERVDDRGSKKKKSKKKRKDSLVDVSTLPLDVSGVSFMLMGNINRSLCEGLIYQHGGVISVTVLKKQQYVVSGPPKRVGRWGGLTGPGTKIWKRAEEAGKVFMTQRDFERWMKRVQKAKDKAETKAHALDEHLTQLLLEATSLSQVLIDLVVAYAVEEHPMLPAVRAWLKLEQRASDDTHASTLPAPATDEQIADVEARLQTRLPFVLRQLLRLHNGAALQGDSAGMRVWPSTADLLRQRADEERYTLPMRWLPWQCQLDSTRMPMHVSTIYFIPPHGPLVAYATANYVYEMVVVSETVEQFVEQYVQTWRSNIDAGEEQPAAEEEKKQTEAKVDMDAGGDDGGELFLKSEENVLTAAEEQEEKTLQAIGSEASGVTAAAATEAESEAEQAESTDSAMSDIFSAAASTLSLSPDARYVAAYRPSALSVSCMQQQWPTLREKHPRVSRQAFGSRVRGDSQIYRWNRGLPW